MGKFLKVLAAVLVTACVVCGQTINWASPGITITNEAQLRELAALVNNGERNFSGQTIILGSNIDLQGNRRNQWVPIGIQTNLFNGIFDGNGNIISGIFIYQQDMDKQGLFGVVGESGIIKNLNISDVNIRGRDAVGGFVGRNYGIVENCRAGANINIRGGSVIFGQLVGYNAGRILNSEALSSNIKLVGWNAPPQGESVAAAQFARLKELQLQQRQEQQRQMQTVQSQNQIVATPLTYREILAEAGLSQYSELFQQHRITDVNMIRSLTNDELREMGVETIGDRRRIMEAFAMASVNSSGAVVVTNVVRPFAEKGVKNLGFGFLTGWGTGIGGNVAWNVGLSDVLSFGLGTTYSAGVTASLRHMYLTPNCRLALHFFSFPSLASRESLSRHDLHIAIRAGATFIWWNNNSDTDFMFDFGMGYRFRLTERTFLLMDGGKENATAGIGFRF